MSLRQRQVPWFPLVTGVWTSIACRLYVHTYIAARNRRFGLGRFVLIHVSGAPGAGNNGSSGVYVMCQPGTSCLRLLRASRHSDGSLLHQASARGRAKTARDESSFCQAYVYPPSRIGHRPPASLRRSPRLTAEVSLRSAMAYVRNPYGYTCQMCRALINLMRAGVAELFLFSLVLPRSSDSRWYHCPHLSCTRSQCHCDCGSGD